MTKFRVQDFNGGDVLNNGSMSQLSNNDDANHSVLLDRPRGVVINRMGYNPRNSAWDYVSTVLDVDHHATSGTSTARPVTLTSVNIPIEPNRRYYIELEVTNIHGKSNNNAPAILISVDGAFKTGQIAHLPVARTTYNVENGLSTAASMRTWYIHETLPTLESNTLAIAGHMQQKFPSSTSILVATCRGITSGHNYFLRVEDWGAVLSSELLV